MLTAALPFAASKWLSLSEKALKALGKAIKIANQEIRPSEATLSDFTDFMDFRLYRLPIEIC
jgi:hypothetical protein